MKGAIEIAQKAEQRKDEIENLRDIPTGLIEEVKKLSLARLWVSNEIGGPQKSVKDVMHIWQSMAYHNGSLAWVTSVTNCSSLISGYLTPKLAQQIFGSTSAIVGGFAGPAGSARITSEGLIVTGKWSWGSGIKHCSHIVGGVRLMKEDTMVGTGIVFLRPEEINFIDNWHVVGMKGTHSIDYHAEDLFISHNRWIPFPPSKPRIDAPLYHFSFLGALALSISSIGLGLAERARDEIKKIIIQKVPLGQNKPLSKQPIVQDKYGRIEGKFFAAESLFYKAIEQAQKEVTHNSADHKMKAQIRLAACMTTQLCTDVVREAYELGGGSAIWNKNKLEELHRDMHVVTQHAMASTANFRTAGTVALGNQVPELLL